MDQEISPPTPLNTESPPVGMDQPPTPHKHRMLLWALVAVILILVVGAAVYMLVLRPKPQAQPTTIDHSSASSQPAVDTSTDTTPTAYVSKGKDLNLSLTYPANWQVSPASGGNTDDQTITLTSPRTSMADATDQSVVAQAVLTIRPKTGDITELDAGTVTIAQNSYQIAYSHPTKVQHGYPYLTFIHLSGGKNPDHLFEEVMVTGAAKFTKDQILSAYSLLNLDPVISVTFNQCLTQDCTGSGAKQLSLTNDTWQSSDLGQQIVAIFESLELQ